ncbi:MAG: ubiquinone/menaquinone biosynthesis methyltransferase [Candidatus Neomarinimicrobiota bacterium]|nr:MAG: ubiquinone/menaquinone biosynthesis methyltransferase [Candidatus Neomarinimicrobiota bacterium]
MSEFSHRGDEKKAFVRSIFDDISPQYDFLNHFLSLGVDLYWRRRLVHSLSLPESGLVLDVATGTGDVGLALRKRYPTVRVVGLDYAYRMVVRSRAKTRRKGVTGFPALQGDGECLPFRDDQFDALTISFGFRNIGHYEVALEEFARVLKPGGALRILEFAQPRSRWFGTVYQAYFHHVLPRLGALFSRSDAYRYLPESVDYFPARQELAALLAAHRFDHIRIEDLTWGVATLIQARKPGGAKAS